MGRWSYSNRTEADSLKKVEISFLNKHGYLTWWKRGTITWTSNWADVKSSITIESSINPGEMYVKFIYTQTERDTGEKKDFDYKIKLTKTKCNLGGERYWFICPLTVNGRYCGKRVGTLYKAGDYFGCRHCYNLTYNSRKLSGLWKNAGKVISIPELEELEKKIKCKYYAGKMTRSYWNYLKKAEKADRQMMTVAIGLGAMNPYKT